MILHSHGLCANNDGAETWCHVWCRDATLLRRGYVRDHSVEITLTHRVPGTNEVINTNFEGRFLFTLFCACHGADGL